MPVYSMLFFTLATKSLCSSSFFPQHVVVCEYVLLLVKQDAHWNPKALQSSQGQRQMSVPTQTQSARWLTSLFAGTTKQRIECAERTDWNRHE